MLHYILIFTLILCGLFTLELLPLGQQLVVVPFTESIAVISSWIIKLFDQGIISHGIVLQDKVSGFAVSIEAGCNGIEATIILIAAMMAFSTTWLMKLIGIIAGFLAIQAMNIIRIISLYYLGQWNHVLFEWAHLYIWQSLIILDVLIVFLIWLRYLPRESIPRDVVKKT
ncbi:MAG: exosortase H [Candidatus Thiodiazotropha sp.]